MALCNGDINMDTRHAKQLQHVNKSETFKLYLIISLFNNAPVRVNGNYEDKVKRSMDTTRIISLQVYYRDVRKLCEEMELVTNNIVTQSLQTIRDKPCN